jgi:glycerol-3-phosphate dehydrogenase (NAD(P)+)
MQRITIIGGGAWGTALATVTRRAGRDVCLWAREAEVIDAINTGHENTPFLPGVRLDPAIQAKSELDAAVADADALLLVTPAQHLRTMSQQLEAFAPKGAPAVICAKGIELETGALMTEVIAETMPGRPMAVLSGPTFAIEVARGLPTAVTLASDDADLPEALAAAIGTPSFRPYLSPDPVGAEVAGAVKNVIAIACGIVHGREMGANAQAALITRGLAEITRLGLARGAKLETLMGLSGLGDLTLTCNSLQSRNMSLGAALGKGEALDDVLGARTSVAEGVWTAPSVTALAARMGIDMPISAAVNAILHEDADIDSTIAALLARPIREEGA